MSDVDGLRREIAEATDAHRERHIYEHRPWGSGHRLVGCVCGWEGTDMRAHRIDAVLPVVTAWAERRARERAAAELRAAAEALAAVPGNPYPLVIREYLNDRAAALADDGRA